MSKSLSAKAFILTQATILSIGLFSVWLLYSFLYPKIPSQFGLRLGSITNPPVQFNLDISNPDDNLIIFGESILISGKTSPKTTVIVSSDNKTLGLESDDKGSFSTVFELSPGLNELEITAFDTAGNPKSMLRSVYYSEEQL